MARKRLDQLRVPRLTYPTLSLTVFKPHYDWVEAEAERRDISKSEVVRELIAEAMTAPPKPSNHPATV